ncbi:ATP-binding protein [Streptomyces tanashiensis]|uniref:ATP-binding protein n=1 Tax=Streptomyces tanashiensis TaxID=67367 RepID=A0ABY6R1Y9_9ACTN|nr:ATP-binding protein [Streptomyces tanashiensis]UZX23515.1 ATP-binding protein [Streptomyces tanashiensis]
MEPARDGDAVVLRWGQAARSVPLARRELRRALARWEWGAVEEAASLVLSELLTNAVRHGHVPGREIETRFARVPGGVLRIEVHDASERRPLMSLPDDGADGGWGLPLVDTLAAKWGVGDRRGPGKLVWAELSVDGEPW